MVIAEFFQHKPKRKVLLRFITIVILLTTYLAIVSQEYGLAGGIYVTALTWSFFVLCTPIADASFLLDFPIRLIANIRMIYQEFFVWIGAVSLNVFTVINRPDIYKRSGLLKAFYRILRHPWPMGLIILVSAAGTFLSIYFGDELLDVVKRYERVRMQKHKTVFRLILLAFLAIALFILYYHLLENFNIQI